jgi:hypothetical protein
MNRPARLHTDDPSLQVSVTADLLSDLKKEKNDKIILFDFDVLFMHYQTI